MENAIIAEIIAEIIADLKSKNIWLVHKNKQPFSVITGRATGTTLNHRNEWVNYLEAKYCLDNKVLSRLATPLNLDETASTAAREAGEARETVGETVGETARETVGETAEGVERTAVSTDWDGIGFVIPRGYFFIDVDHQDINSPLVQELMTLFKGVYAEISPSGTGVHFYGKCDPKMLPTESANPVVSTEQGSAFSGSIGSIGSIVRLAKREESPTHLRLSSRYYTKNTAKGLEIYVGGLTSRYSTFTGNALKTLVTSAATTTAATTSETDGSDGSDGSKAKTAGVDAGKSVEAIVSTGEGAGVGEPLTVGKESPDKSGPDKSSKSDRTKELLIFLEKYMKKTKKQISKFEAQAKKEEAAKNLTPPWGMMEGDWKRLTENDVEEVIADLRKFENGAKFISLFDRGEYEKTQSEADLSLCAMIAFRVGPDPDMIDRIFCESKLYRDKWDREDYAERTIAKAIEACHGNFYAGLRQRPPFVSVSDKGKESVVATRLADFVANHLNYYIVRSASRTTDPQIFVYRNDLYKLYSKQLFEGAINSFIQRYDKDLVKMSITDEAIRILMASEVYLNMSDLNANELIVNVSNGLLDIETLEFRPHTPKIFSTIKLDVEWGPLQQAGILEPTPTFDAYMEDLTAGDKAIYRFLLQFMGAVFSNVSGKTFKKSLFMKGEGNSGKSQLKLLTEKILGDENYAIIDLGQLEERFGTSSLYGKRLAGAADLSYMSIKELKTFKEITGGDHIRAEFKGKDSFRFQYQGLFWFCMNDLPRFGGDLGKWVYDRIVIIPCNNVIPEERRDPFLINKLYAERNGIFQKAILAFREIALTDYKFIEPPCALVEREAYKVENSPVIEFFVTCMEARTGDIGRNDVSRIDPVYAVHRAWYKDQGYNMSYIKSKKDFFNEIAEYIGIPYEDMKKRARGGWSLKGYVLTKEVIQRYGYAMPITNLHEEIPPLVEH